MSKRVLYQDVRPYDVPTSLAALHGPAGGRVELDVAVYWGPNPVVDLDTDDGRAKAYEALISNGRTADQEELMNADLLIQVWPRLLLPRRAQALWEERFPELAAA